MQNHAARSRYTEGPLPSAHGLLIIVSRSPTNDTMPFPRLEAPRIGGAGSDLFVGSLHATLFGAHRRKRRRSRGVYSRQRWRHGGFSTCSAKRGVASPSAFVRRLALGAWRRRVTGPARRRRWRRQFLNSSQNPESMPPAHRQIGTPRWRQANAFRGRGSPSYARFVWLRP